jgi:hypothetical protein
MGTVAQSVNKQTRFKRQAAKGTIATTSAGQILRRNSSVFELQRDTYNTMDEINSAQQLMSVRLGAKLASGQISGILSPGTHSDLISALLRRDYAAVTAITAASFTIAGTGPTYTVTRAAGSFLTDGIKKGMVVRLTAGSFNAANLNVNLFVVAVTATVITVLVVNGGAMVAEGPIASATMSIPGKVTYAPNSGQTAIYYTFEEWMPDVPFSERFQDVRIGQAQIAIPGSGNATIQMQLQGLDYSTGTTAYYTAPTTETTSESVGAASGVLQVNGATQAVVTDMQLTITGNQNPGDPVVGSNVRPDIFEGKVTVSGSFTAYFDSSTITGLFSGESDVSILCCMANGSGAAADFITVHLPKLNLTSATPSDGSGQGLKRSYNFQCEYYAAGGAGTDSQQSTIQMQDSLAP